MRWSTAGIAGLGLASLLASSVLGAARADDVSSATALAHREAPSPTTLVRVGAGRYRGLLERGDEPSIEVAAFLLEQHPVTRAQFRAFVEATPRWRRGAVPVVLAEERYLASWASANDPGADTLAQPATEISWHAARAYCRAQGRRLPTEAEWEWAARADATRADATGDAEHTRRVLDWYARPHRGALPGAGTGEPNVWGVRDLHGLVWEWVEDFGASMVASDDRERESRSGARVCGAGAMGGGDPGEYATFMRFAFRSSLRAEFALPRLGFRCAADAEE